MANDRALPTSIPVPPAAEQAAARLRAALADAGFDLERDFTAVRADVTTSGQGFITIGRLMLATAERLCELLESSAHEAPHHAPQDHDPGGAR
jgi:hypothetical protein